MIDEETVDRARAFERTERGELLASLQQAIAMLGRVERLLELVAHGLDVDTRKAPNG
jgi:hypothetical protein